MFACCTAKFVLDSVDASAVSSGPSGLKLATPLWQSGQSGCTGPNCQGPSGCVNVVTGSTGSTGPSDPSGPS